MVFSTVTSFQSQEIPPLLWLQLLLKVLVSRTLFCDPLRHFLTGLCLPFIAFFVSSDSFALTALR